MKKLLFYFFLSSGAFWAKNLALFSQYRFQLYSIDPRQREAAVSYFMQDVDEESLTILYEHLLYERNHKILEKLLNFFANRKSKDDFFYLLDFLSLSPNLDLAVEAAKIMKEIHRERSRKELLALAEKSPLYFLIYLKVFTPPDELSFYDAQKKLGDESLRLAILAYSAKMRDIFIEALSPYYFADSSLLANDTSSVLLKTFILEQAQKEVLPEYFAEMPALNLPEFAILLYLQKKFQYNPNSYDFEKTFVEAKKQEVLRFFLLQISPFIKNKEILLKITEEAQSGREILWIFRNFENLSEETQKVFCKKKLNPNLPKSFLNRKKFLCENKPTYGDFANLNLYLKEAHNLKTEQIYYLLREKDFRYRQKAYHWLSPKIFEKYPVLYKILWLKEKDRTLRIQLFSLNTIEDIVHEE